MAAVTAAVVVVATAPKAVQKGAPRAVRTLDQKVGKKFVQKARDVTNAANAAQKAVQKASARTAPWVKAASRVNPAVKAATSHVVMLTSHVLMSAWTPAPKVDRKVSHARNRASLAQSQAAVAANVPKAVASEVNHALKPANPVVNGSSATLSSKTRHWPIRRPWLPQGTLTVWRSVSLATLKVAVNAVVSAANAVVAATTVAVSATTTHRLTRRWLQN